MSQRIAVLIDAENTSVNYIDAALKEMNQYGDITVQRMYGDFSNNTMHEWSKKGLEYAIVPVHQTRFTASKNASDIMLVIDAMDILYQGIADIFCILSSDSDYTRLASRLREGGKKVIGMGKSDASKTFITACNEYKYLDIITQKVNDVKENPTSYSAITPMSDVKKELNFMMQQAEGKGERLNMGSAKSQLQRVFPDFDERNYDFSSFRRLIEEETKFVVNIEGSTAYIGRDNKPKEDSQVSVKDFVTRLASPEIDLGILGKEIHSKYPDFNVKDLGYSKLYKYVESIPGIKLKVVGGSIVAEFKKEYVVGKG